MKRPVKWSGLIWAVAAEREQWAYGSLYLLCIALRIHVRTLFEGGIHAIAKARSFIPPLLHPILEPLSTNAQFGLSRRESGRRYHHSHPAAATISSIRVATVKTSMIDDDDIPWLQLRQQRLL